MNGSIGRLAKRFGVASSLSTAVLAISNMPVTSIAIVCGCALTGFAMYLLTQCWLAHEERLRAVDLAKLEAKAIGSGTRKAFTCQVCQSAPSGSSSA
jgi:hypothetical protein